MLINADLCDTIAYVQLYLKATPDVTDSLFYKYATHVGLTDVAKKFIPKCCNSKEVFDALSYSGVTCRWFIDTAFHYVRLNGLAINEVFLAELLVKFDEREFMRIFIDDDRYEEIATAILTFGTLDQVKWFHSIDEDLGVSEISEIAETVARLDVVQFVYEVRPNLFDGIEVTDIYTLSHNGSLVKRDLETLEYIISKIVFEPRIPQFYEDYGAVMFFRNMICQRDESLLEWLFINKPQYIERCVNIPTVGETILYDIAVHCSSRLFIMFASVANEGFRINRRHNQDMVANFAYLTSKLI